MGNVSHDAHICLMADYVIEVGNFHTVFFCYHLQSVYQVLAGMDEHIPSVGHGYAILMRTKTYAFRTFTYMSETVRIDCFYCHVVVGYFFFRHKESHCGIAPEMSAHLIRLIGIIRIVFRAYNKGFCCLIHCEIAFNDFKAVDK